MKDQVPLRRSFLWLDLVLDTMFCITHPTSTDFPLDEMELGRRVAWALDHELLGSSALDDIICHRCRCTIAPDKAGLCARCQPIIDAELRDANGRAVRLGPMVMSKAGTS